MSCNPQDVCDFLVLSLSVQTNLSQPAWRGPNICNEEQVSVSTPWQPPLQSNFSASDKDFFFILNLLCSLAEVFFTSEVSWVFPPFINTLDSVQGDERSREIHCACIVCLRSPSRKNVGSQKKSILTWVSCSVTFDLWPLTCLTLSLNGRKPW